MAGSGWDPDDVLVVIGHPYRDLEMPLAMVAWDDWPNPVPRWAAEELDAETARKESRR